jgi:hypothetical protein
MTKFRGRSQRNLHIPAPFERTRKEGGWLGTGMVTAKSTQTRRRIASRILEGFSISGTVLVVSCRVRVAAIVFSVPSSEAGVCFDGMVISTAHSFDQIGATASTSTCSI